jgi:hypothetical protein
MSIQDFRTSLEAGKENSSLFVALTRLSRLGSLKDLIRAAVTDGAGGWAYWTDSNPGLADSPALAKA